jgi:hypothetical protein
MTAKTYNSNSNKNNNKQRQEQTTATAKYRGLSTARRMMMPSAAPVEMTSSLWSEGDDFSG